ncbi:hypothetical protein TorRG33x02_245110 [Trema orientale]|uniref:Ribosomal protein n=1 Tax=Trema orientale TaxID=63057 RepID=A0A2P5DQ53_TREOI|nr:hypothetical protein TorRG33x02_245110 [Trema orientale]
MWPTQKLKPKEKNCVCCGKTNSIAAKGSKTCGIRNRKASAECRKCMAIISNQSPSMKLYA